MNSDPSFFPPYPATLRCLNDVMRFAASRETFEIHPAVLHTPGEPAREIYFVAMRGTNRSFDKNDVLGIHTCLMAFLSKPNIYFDKVKADMLASIPAGASVAMVGHSLGGMIAQQIVADRQMKETFSFINLLNIGSPYVPLEGRECPFRRFADKADIVPWLGRSIKANLVTEKPVFQSNGYFGKIVGAHTDSYRESDSWRVYDAFGELNGGRVIVMTDIPAQT